MLSKRENALLAYEGEKPEYVPCFFDSCQIIPDGSGLNLPPIGPDPKPAIDGWGTEQTPTKSSGDMYTPTPTTPPILPLDDIENWRDYVVLPDYSQVPHEMIANGIQQAMNLNQDMFVQDFFCCNGIFERLHFWMGFENALIALKTEPEIVYDIAGAIADTKISYIPYAKKYFNIDYFTFLDDYAHMNGLFMSREDFQKLFKPHLARVVQAVEDAGMKYKHHSCGKMQDLFDDLLDIGIKRFDPVQPVNDLNAMRKRAGKKVCLMGGLDVQGVIDIDGVTDEQIEAEGKRCCETYAQDGGYIVYGASLNMYNPASYMPGGILFKLNQAVEKYGHIY